MTCLFSSLINSHEADKRFPGHTKPKEVINFLHQDCYYLTKLFGFVLAQGLLQSI